MPPPASSPARSTAPSSAVYAIGTPLQQRRLGLGIGLMLLAMLTHGTWDAIGAIGGATAIGAIAVFLFSIFALAMLLVTMRKTAGQEREFLRAILQPEVANGTISAAELDAVCASRKQRRRFIRAGKGHRAHHNAKHVLRASLDLAHEIADAQGADTLGVQHERDEIARLRSAAPTASPSPSAQ